MIMENDKITNALDMIIAKINNLEKEQVESREIISKIKFKLLELNGFMNDIIDVIENDNYYEADAPIIEKINKFKDLNNAITKSVDSDENEKDYLKLVMSEIIGES